MKKTQNIILVSPEESRKSQITGYLSQSKDEGIRKEVNERKYSVKDTRINYRTINHWKSIGLLSKEVQRGSGWSKFNFIEIVWLKIIEKMRDFGFSLDKILNVKECLENLPETYSVDCEGADLFEYFVVQTWKTDFDPNLIITKEGEASIGTLPEIMIVMNCLGHRDVILIPIVTSLYDMKLDVPDKPSLVSLNQQYLDLYNEIAMGDHSEIKLKMSGGKLKEMETISKINPLFAKEIQNQMQRRGEYGELSTSMEKGVPQTVQVRKRKRF